AYPFSDNENIDLDDSKLTDTSPQDDILDFSANSNKAYDASENIVTVEEFKPSENIVTAEEFKPYLENLVKTNDHLFNLFKPHYRKFKVIMLPISKGYHYVYKVIVTPKSKFGKPKIYDIYVTPLRKKKCLEIVSIPRHAPSQWKAKL
ncbi:11322_t:CDS:2, partial [Scutellospora calospora]